MRALLDAWIREAEPVDKRYTMPDATAISFCRRLADICADPALTRLRAELANAPDAPFVVVHAAASSAAIQKAERLAIHAGTKGVLLDVATLAADLVVNFLTSRPGWAPWLPVQTREANDTLFFFATPVSLVIERAAEFARAATSRQPAGAAAGDIDAARLWRPWTQILGPVLDDRGADFPRAVAGGDVVRGALLANAGEAPQIVFRDLYLQHASLAQAEMGVAALRAAAAYLGARVRIAIPWDSHLFTMSAHDPAAFEVAKAREIESTPGGRGLRVLAPLARALLIQPDRLAADAVHILLLTLAARSPEERAVAHAVADIRLGGDGGGHMDAALGTMTFLASGFAPRVSNHPTEKLAADVHALWDRLAEFRLPPSRHLARATIMEAGAVGLGAHGDASVKLTFFEFARNGVEWQQLVRAAGIDTPVSPYLCILNNYRQPLAETQPAAVVEMVRDLAAIATVAAAAARAMRLVIVPARDLVLAFTQYGAALEALEEGVLGDLGASRADLAAYKAAWAAAWKKTDVKDYWVASGHALQ